jgi:hypothetical protein
MARAFALVWLGAVAIGLTAAGGCGKKSTHKRPGDARAVEVITAPALPDSGVAGGAPSEEIEPNDGDDVATVLGLGATVRGKIDPDGDVDHYRIDVTEAGVLSVMVDGQDALDVQLEIDDASGTPLVRSDRGGPRIREGVPNLGVTPGRYIAVVQAKKPPPAKPVAKKKPSKKGPPPPPPEPPKPIGGPYEISARMVAIAAGAEHEPDDDRGEAGDLIAGDLGTGYIGWTGDADVWKVSVEALSAKNALDIELTAVEGIALSLEISDGVGQPIVTRKGAKGGPLVIRGFIPAVPAGAPPFHYLTVRADRSNPETAYQIRAIAKVIPPDAEIEPNDTPETAMAFPSDRKGLHAHWSTGDVDCFAIAPDPAGRTLEVSIDTPNDLDLAIDLLVDGKLVTKVDHPGRGAAERLVAPVPANARAVIRVRGADIAGDGAYELVVAEGAGPP